MKAITIHQPFAEMILRGVKRCENRTWSTRHRGVLVIHAAAGGAGPFPAGALVGLVTLSDCRHIGEGHQHELFAQSDHDLIHATGPWCWCLDRPRRFAKPIFCSGRQGLWTVPDDLVEMIGAMIAAKSG